MSMQISKKPLPQWQANPYIWEVPEVQEKVRLVKQHIVSTLMAKNLFAWRKFVDELQADIELEIYRHEEEYRQKIGEYAPGGKWQRPTVGMFCNMAMQGAMNYVAYYSAAKRSGLTKVYNSDGTPQLKKNGKPVTQAIADASLDFIAETEKSTLTAPIQIPDNGADMERRKYELLLSIAQEFGEEISVLAQKVIDNDESLSSEDLKMLRKKFRKTEDGELLRELLLGTY